jgi:hypothetical protein
MYDVYCIKPLKLFFSPPQTKTLMGEVMKEAAFSLAEAKFATGEFNQVVLQNVTKAQIKIRTKKDNVAGMYRFNARNLLTYVFSYKSRHNLMGWHVDSSEICMVSSVWSTGKQVDFIIIYIYIYIYIYMYCISSVTFHHTSCSLYYLQSVSLCMSKFLRRTGKQYIILYCNVTISDISK